MLTGLVLALLSVSAVAVAAPPDRFSEEGASVFCELAEGFVGISAFESEEFRGLDVFVDLGDVLLFGFAEGGGLDGTSLTGSVDLIDEFTGEPAGTATVDAELTPVGEPDTFSDRSRFGNRIERFEGTFQSASPSGTLVLDGVVSETIDLAVCEGSLFSTSVFATNPAAFVDRFQGTSIECAVDGPGYTGFVFAFDEPDGGAFLDVFLELDAGGLLSGFAESLTFTDDEISATIGLVDELTGEPAGTAAFDATLSVVDVVEERFADPPNGASVTREILDVDATFSVDGVAAAADCMGESFEGRSRFVDPPGRSTNGPRVRNDLPEDAEPLAVPASVTLRTGGASEAPEAPCVATFVDGDEVIEFEVPLGRTAWYLVEGTGSAVTVDTAGSDFDTVVGVYDTALEQIACVDDVAEEPDFFSLQAAVTFDTVVGQQYLVQIGGFAGDAGRLVVTTS